MSSDNMFERLFKLWASVCKLIVDGKRDAEEVAKVLQEIVDGNRFGTTLLGRLLNSVKFGLVDPNINPGRFPEEAVRSQDYKVYRFDFERSSKAVIEEMAKDGYVPANLYEFLLWTDWNGIHYVVVLGSSCFVDGKRFVPWLHSEGGKSMLGLNFWDGSWGAHFCFLAVRNPQPAVIEP